MFPLSTWGPAADDSFDLKTREDFVAAARNLIDGHHPGVFTTVDEDGRPHARWMASLAFDNFPDIVTLTAPNSAKMKHIARHPSVNWMFSNYDLSLVINLHGTARRITDTASIKRVWRSVEDKSHAYFLEHFTERPGFAVIQTKVEEMTCCVPASGLIWAWDIRTSAGVTKIQPDNWQQWTKQ